MKIILITALLLTSIHAEFHQVDTSRYDLKPYVSIGGSFSNANEKYVECRISAVGIAGVRLNEYVSTEVRYSYGMSGDYKSWGIYLKPQYESVYALIGGGNTEFDHTDINSPRFGLGYQFNPNDKFIIFSDIIYRWNEGDTAATVGVMYEW